MKTLKSFFLKKKGSKVLSEFLKLNELPSPRSLDSESLKKWVMNFDQIKFETDELYRQRSIIRNINYQHASQLQTLSDNIGLAKAIYHEKENCLFLLFYFIYMSKFKFLKK